MTQSAIGREIGDWGTARVGRVAGAATPAASYGERRMAESAALLIDEAPAETLLRAATLEEVLELALHAGRRRASLCRAQRRKRWIVFRNELTEQRPCGAVAR